MAPAPGPDEPVGEQLGADVEEYLDGTPFLAYHVRAVLVAVEGESVLDLYRDSTPAESRDVMSVTRSVVSTLVGIAVGEGLLSLERPSRTSSWSTPRPCPSSRPVRRSAAAEHDGALPQHMVRRRGGRPERRLGCELALGRDTPPAGSFSSSDPSANLVAVVLERAVGATGVVSTEVGFDEPDPRLHPSVLTQNLVRNVVVPVAVQLQGARD